MIMNEWDHNSANIIKLYFLLNVKNLKKDL